EIRDTRPDHVNAEDRSVPRLGHHLDEAVGVAGGHRPAERPERELPDPDLGPSLARLGLRESDGRDLRLAVDARGHVRGIEAVAVATLAGDRLDRDDPLLGRRVREQKRPDDVADRIHAVRTRSHVRVDDDESALRADADGVEPEVVGERRATDGDEDARRVDVPARPTGLLDRHPAPIPRACEGRVAMSGQHLDALAPECPLEFATELRVHAREEGLRHLHDGHPPAPARPAPPPHCTTTPPRPPPPRRPPAGAETREPRTAPRRARTPPPPPARPESARPHPPAAITP